MPRAPAPNPCRPKKKPMWAPRLPRMLWYASGASGLAAFWINRMSNRPVTNEERMPRAKTKDRARDTSPATVRIRSSPHASLACRMPGRVVHQTTFGPAFFLAADALAVRFLRFPLLPVEGDSGSLSESRVFFAMGSTNLNAQQALGLWGRKASSRKGVQKALRQTGEFAIFANQFWKLWRRKETAFK